MQWKFYVQFLEGLNLAIGCAITAKRKENSFNKSRVKRSIVYD